MHLHPHRGTREYPPSRDRHPAPDTVPSTHQTAERNRQLNLNAIALEGDFETTAQLCVCARAAWVRVCVRVHVEMSPGTGALHPMHPRACIVRFLKYVELLMAIGDVVVVNRRLGIAAPMKTA